MSNPNPSYGKVPTIRKLQTLATVLTVLPFVAGKTLLARLVRKSVLTLKDDLRRAVTRSYVGSLDSSYHHLLRVLPVL